VTVVGAAGLYFAARLGVSAGCLLGLRSGAVYRLEKGIEGDSGKPVNVSGMGMHAII
jgi:hypothetical protein